MSAEVKSGDFFFFFDTVNRSHAVTSQHEIVERVAT